MGQHNNTVVPPPPNTPSEPPLPFGDLTTRQVVDRLLVPALPPGHSYAEAQARSRGGAVAANTLVCHAWDDSFCVLVETLLLRFNSPQAKQDTRLWIGASRALVRLTGVCLLWPGTVSVA